MQIKRLYFTPDQIALMPYELTIIPDKRIFSINVCSGDSEIRYSFEGRTHYYTLAENGMTFSVNQVEMYEFDKLLIKLYNEVGSWKEVFSLLAV